MGAAMHDSFFCFYIVVYLYKCFTCEFLCILYDPGAQRDQERVSGPLDVELQLAVTCHVVAGN